MIVGSLKVSSDVLLKVAAVKKINTNSTFSGAPAGAVKAEFEYTMGNNSAPFPKGIGVEVSFVDAEDADRRATLLLDIPAIGKHIYKEVDINGFKVSLGGDDDNNYTAVLKKVRA